MLAKRRIGMVALVFLLGVVLGSVVGELISLLLPDENVIKELFVSGKVLRVGPLHFEMIVFTINIEFSLKVNLVSVLGIIVVAFLLRMYC